MQRGLERARVRRRERHQRLVADEPVGLGAGAVRLEERQLLRVGRDQELAATPMRNPPLGAVAQHGAPTGDAEPRLQHARRVEDAGMQDLAAARRRAGTEPFRRLEDQDVAPGERLGARDREPDDAGADDDRCRRRPSKRPYAMALPSRSRASSAGEKPQSASASSVC